MVCALHFRDWVLWFKKKKERRRRGEEKKKQFCKLLKYPKARFQKRGVRGKNEQGFLLRFQSWLQKKVSALAILYMRGVRGGSWAEHASLLWSGALVAIQTQINRGGTLELMIEEGGGGVSEGGLSTPAPRSPEKCRTGAHYAHFQPQLRTGLPRRRAPLQTSSPLFHKFSQLVTSLQRSATSELAAWLHESFMDLEVGKLLAALYWSSSPL